MDKPSGIMLLTMLVFLLTGDSETALNFAELVLLVVACRNSNHS